MHGVSSAESNDPFERGPRGAESVARRYAQKILGDVGAESVVAPGCAALDPAVEWARSGAMALTGSHLDTNEAVPVVPAAPVASCARGLGLAAAALWPSAEWGEERRGADRAYSIDTPALLGEHAALRGWTRPRRGDAPVPASVRAPVYLPVSVNGSCRLLPTRTGWIAVNLARSDDLELVPAWLEIEGRLPLDPWCVVAKRVADLDADTLVARARLMGMPVAPCPRVPQRSRSWLRVEARGERRSGVLDRPPRVVDLSALWAGPLCTHLLERAGAEVIKVESSVRPDGTRNGNAAFFDLLNTGKRSVVLDFASQEGRSALGRLLSWADVVVESARPRALLQLGIDAAQTVKRRPGMVWLSLTGYGREEPFGRWVAFGDDAAVAGGLATATGGLRRPLFCGDAIADPLSGLHALVSVLAALRAGGGVLLDVSLRDVVAAVCEFERRDDQRRDDRCRDDQMDGVCRVVGGERGFQLEVAGRRVEVASPRARARRGRATPLGADTRAVLASLEEVSPPC